jgi:flagellar biosynthesis protein FlhB
VSETKTHDPSVSKLARAARRGDVATSRDLISAAALFGAWLGFVCFGRALVDACFALLRACASGMQLAHAERVDLISAALAGVGRASLALMLLPMAFGWLTALVQTGFSFAPREAASSRMFDFGGSREHVVETSWSMLKLAVVACVVGAPLLAALPGLLDTHGSEPAQLAGHVSALASSVLARAAGAFLLLGVADLVYRRIRRFQRLRMTRHEALEEHKASDGDPKLRAERRRRARRSASASGLEEVSRCALIVRGHEGRVVGLRFEARAHDVPRVWLKAEGELSVQVVARAADDSVPVHDDTELCQHLLRMELSEPVEAAHYARVAQLLTLRGGK